VLVLVPLALSGTRDVKSILAIACAVLIGNSAVAADLEMKCRGRLSEAYKPATLIKTEFVVSISGGEVTIKANPEHDIGGTPIPSVLKLVLKKSDHWSIQFESVELSKRPDKKGKRRIFGIFIRRDAFIFIERFDDKVWHLGGDCEFLVGMHSSISPKVA
jgi:hypothetical protein